MKYIFIWIMFLTLSCQNNQKVKQLKGGTITIQEYDTPASEIEISLSEEDSLLYHEVVADYGNYWETIIKKNQKNQKKQVLFNLYSGKIAVYINKDEKAIINNESSDYNFSWETDTLNPYKIIGIYSEIDKDTLLFWKYNPNTKQLIDENGLRYYRKTFKN